MKEETRQALLYAVQQGIPLEERPFALLGASLGLEEAEVLAQMEEFVRERMLRRISPIYETKMLGYQSALVAMEIPEEAIEEAASLINQHPGVSHNYERAHRFNLWFTLAIPPDSSLGLEKTIAKLASAAKATQSAILRARYTFKIGVKLDPKKSALAREEIAVREERMPRPLSPRERQIIAVTQKPLALEAMPYAAYAQELGMSSSELLSKLRGFVAEGILRRVAAIAFHRKIGFRANGMAVWAIPEAQVHEIGAKLTSFTAISHCYLRETSSGWPYNLFAMMHGKERQEIEELAASISSEMAIPEPTMLFSLREFKKQRLHYFDQATDTWERQLVAG
jgi:DNA-binding Lrp family transcriptional regulator